MAERRAALSDLLRTCVECGLCLPHCATFLATGSEVQSPRGRLVLLEALLEAPPGEDGPPADFLSAFDQCIGCRACETVCPSGVPYELLAHGHDLAAGAAMFGPRPAVPGPILRRLDRPGFLRLVGAAAGLARATVRLVLGKTWRGRLGAAGTPWSEFGRLIGSVPRSPHRDDDVVALLDRLIRRSGRLPLVREQNRKGGFSSRRVLFFSGCSNRGLLAGTSRRLRECLRQAGFDVVTPSGQECCGALADHTGRPGRAAVLQARNRVVFGAFGGEPDAIVAVEAAGCRLELGPVLAQTGLPLADPVALLGAGSPPTLRAVPLKVALHDPCHNLGAVHVSRELLHLIPGLSWCEPDEVHVCCGSGGAWGLRYPELSAELARRKARDLAATGADLVVTTNPGCLGQIADGLAIEAPDVPILPLTDLWWYAARDGARGS